MAPQSLHGVAIGEASFKSPSSRPITMLDAPARRRCALAVYVGLMSWRIYDHMAHNTDNSDAFWLFTKWVGIDTAFLYTLATLQVPWLSWSTATFTAVFVVHAFLNWCLMFRIFLPLSTWLTVASKLMYDRELSISERRVQPNKIIQNLSPILGKQIIEIVPQSHVTIDTPQYLCIGPQHPFVTLSLLINGTIPNSIELTRSDLDANDTEIIHVNGKEIHKQSKRADSMNDKGQVLLAWHFNMTTTKQGVYNIQRVLDESDLEITILPKSSIVTACPQGDILPIAKDKCPGDLTNFHINLDAIPPVHVKYSRAINSNDKELATFDFTPEKSLYQSEPGLELLRPLEDRTSHAKVEQQAMKIPINDSLGTVGLWQYTLLEIHDSLGNRVKYSSPQHVSKTSTSQIQDFIVHPRPRLAFLGCNANIPRRIAAGQQTLLKFKHETHNKFAKELFPLEVKYSFQPASNAGVDGDSGHVQLHHTQISDPTTGLEASDAGVYTILSVSSKYCMGDVEPSSCTIEIPSEPEMQVGFQTIADSCADTSIGIFVNLELSGSPPFRVYYKVLRPDGRKEDGVINNIDRWHWQVEFKPEDAGAYSYDFTHISDAVYQQPKPLVHKDLVVAQNVHPRASVTIANINTRRSACLEENLAIPFELHGDGPFDVEVEVVHQGQRRKSKLVQISGDRHSFMLDNLSQGGEWTVNFVGITDKTGCKTSLNHLVHVDVSPSLPRIAFGHIAGMRNLSILEGQHAQIPLRLQGKAPWTVEYTYTGRAGQSSHVAVLHHENDRLDVHQAGLYELVHLRDAKCSGVADASHKIFEVAWIPRPTVEIRLSKTDQKQDSDVIKGDVCRGGENLINIEFTGNPPFTFDYEIKAKNSKGSSSVMKRHGSSGSFHDTIRIDSRVPGHLSYNLVSLSDASYEVDLRTLGPPTVHQIVHDLPSAHFSEAGKTYQYCHEGQWEDHLIPTVLTGQPPFHLQYEIRYSGVRKAEMIDIPVIESENYLLDISHRTFSLGTHSIHLSRVRDSRGCESVLSDDASMIRISVVETPSISSTIEHQDVCVGDRIIFQLDGTPPFNVLYTFAGRQQRAILPDANFKRITDAPGKFTIDAISDQKSGNTCRSEVSLSRTVHPMPSVRLSKGKTTKTSIHEGSKVAMLLEFTGTPPFRFIFTRSRAKQGEKSAELLETRDERSDDMTMTILVSEEGIYEVTAIRDNFCAFSIGNQPILAQDPAIKSLQ